MDWTQPGSLTKKFKVTQSAGKVLTAVFSDSLICSWWTSCNMDTQLTPTRSVPRWKACERYSRENDSVFLAMVWFTSKIMSSCTRHGRPRTCCRNLAGKRCTVPHTVRIWHSEMIFCFAASKQHVTGYRSTCHADVRRATTTSLTQRGRMFCVPGMNKLIIRCDKCLVR